MGAGARNGCSGAGGDTACQLELHVAGHAALVQHGESDGDMTVRGVHHVQIAILLRTHECILPDGAYAVNYELPVSRF